MTMAPQRPTEPRPSPSAGPAGGAPRSLLERLVAGEVRAAVTFAGQATEPLEDLAALVATRPDVRPLVDAASEHLAGLATSPEGAASGRFRHGLDVRAWADDPDAAPDAAYRRTSAVSHPLILLTQLARWHALWLDGLAEVWAAGGLVGVTGHSQGVLAALAVAEAPGGRLDDARVAHALTLGLLQGAGLGGPSHPVRGLDGGAVTPMAAISGASAERLQPSLDTVNATLPADQAVVVALHNTPTRVVVSGPPATLARLRAELDARTRREEHARRRGEHGGAPLAVTWSALPVELPFHHPLQRPHLLRFLDRVAGQGLVPAGGAFGLAVLSPADGHDLRTEADVLAAAAATEYLEPVRWDRTVAALTERGADWVLDLGPGTDVARLTAEDVRGTGARVLALASPEGRRILGTPGAAPDGPDVRYADLAPGLVELPDGRRHVDNRYTRATGRPPVLLAGMTPTTADVGHRGRRRQRRLHRRAGRGRAAHRARSCVAGWRSWASCSTRASRWCSTPSSSTGTCGTSTSGARQLVLAGPATGRAPRRRHRLGRRARGGGGGRPARPAGRRRAWCPTPSSRGPSSRCARCWPSPTPPATTPSSCTWRGARAAATTRGRTSTSCSSTPTTTSGCGPTWCCASAAGSASPARAADLLTGAWSLPPRRAAPCRWTACCWARSPWPPPRPRRRPR